MAVGYEKLYAYLLGQIDEVLTMITVESGGTTPGILLRRIETKLQDALWEAEDRYISHADGEENIDFAALYSALKEGVRTAAKEKYVPDGKQRRGLQFLIQWLLSPK